MFGATSSQKPALGGISCEARTCNRTLFKALFLVRFSKYILLRSSRKPMCNGVPAEIGQLRKPVSVIVARRVSAALVRENAVGLHQIQPNSTCSCSQGHTEDFFISIEALCKPLVSTSFRSAVKGQLTQTM
eukprot:Plantae.Rhodophyta-Rhodochaete_pulchella.ctg2648.p1 GENE.Plantae.Rhodophyta-Rhodochaete_pulchella.ctg2648~~Plantae.Rhodophyta-Rhodochaete_pulchella.ctg2648.p1  ORF type:complete len:131 (+),score=4.93 Plantae.Rhodophyta-Rhodochaete_pulchella.ctg2648:222-614(+)